MKKIVIKELHYQNFRMMQDFTLKLGEGQTVVEARNGVGKTSLFDGFSWLLFDKDSQGKKLGEAIKTKINGIVQSGLEHSVTGKFLLNDTDSFELKKVFYEKWVSKRGSTEKTFECHTTDYYIDGQKVQQKKYNEFIENLVDEDLFKLLTNPMYFNVNLDTSKRREMLFEIFGDLISDDDIINLKQDFAIVKKILEKHTLQEVITSSKKEANKLNKEIQAIPAQIKENENTIFSCKLVEPKKLVSMISDSNKSITNLQERIQEVKNGGLIAKKKIYLIEVEGEIKKIESTSSGVDPLLQTKLNKAYDLLQVIKNDISDKQIQIKRKESEINAIEENTVPLRVKKKELESYIPDVKEFCESCGSPIPEEKRQEALSKANYSIAEELKNIKQKGMNYKKEKETCIHELGTQKQELELLNERLEKGNAYVESVKTQLEESKVNGADLSYNERYNNLKRQQDTLKLEIIKLQDDSQDIIKELTLKLNTANEEHNKLLKTEAQQDIVDSSKKRIEELKQKEIDLAEKYELLSERINTLEEYNLYKSEIIESKMSERFTNVKFKLFEKQVNGEIKAVCKTVYGNNGIAFDEGLNNGHRILAGLDIIKVFSEHYGVYLPIFIDNAEGITEDYECSSQHIELRAVKNDAMTITGGVAQQSLSNPVKANVVEYDDLDELF